MNDLIPIVIALISGVVAMYAAFQSRGTEAAKLGQVYTEKYLERLEKRVEKMEAEIVHLQEVNERLKEQNLILRARLKDAGIA